MSPWKRQCFHKIVHISHTFVQATPVCIGTYVRVSHSANKVHILLCADVLCLHIRMCKHPFYGTLLWLTDSNDLFLFCCSILRVTVKYGRCSECQYFPKKIVYIYMLHRLFISPTNNRSFSYLISIYLIGVDLGFGILSVETQVTSLSWWTFGLLSFSSD